MRDYDIESDLKQEKFQNIKLVQGDTGNKIRINVFEEGQPVNLTGCSIAAKYKRSDGEIVNGTVENISGNSFDAVMDSSITKVVGTLKMLFTIEKDAVKVSTFLLLADVREGLLENTGSSGGGEVTVDLKDYQKKTDNGLETKNKYIVGAINEVNSQCKDIAKKIENVGGFDTSKFMYVTKEVEDVDVPCTGIALNTNTLTFTGSDTQTLTVTKTPSNTTDKVTYATNPTGIVVVNNGVVTPIKNGSTVITVTCGSKTATCNVTVAGISTTVAVQSVSLNKNTTTINVGETETLVATISPIDATNQNVTWGTDAPNIATVTNGVIEGKAVGTASISVETVDGSHTDTCNVTVQQNTTGTSKNIFDKDTMLANPAKGINSTARYSTIDASWKACEIPVKANTQYSIKKCESTLYSKYSSGQNGNIGFLNSDRNLISSLHLAQRSVIDDAFLTNYPMAVAIEDYSNTGTTTIDWVTITTPENCAYLVFNTNLGCTPDTVQVEEGDTIHNYYTSYKGGNN